jgi:hypothetical protein
MKRELRATSVRRGSRSSNRPVLADAKSVLDLVSQPRLKPQGFRKVSPTFTETGAQFRDPTRQDVFHQIDALRSSIRRIEQRLFKAARNEDEHKVGKLSSLLANQRAKVQLLADRVAIEGLKPRETVSRDKLAFGSANYSQEDLANRITAPAEGKPSKVEPEEVYRKGPRLQEGRKVGKQFTNPHGKPKGFVKYSAHRK